MAKNPSDLRVANIYSAEFKPFVYEDGAALGDSVLQLDDDLPLGVGFHVYRMPAGMTTRPHRHNGHEQFLILEGELVEDDGTVFRKGDLVWYRDGSEHSSYSRMAACWPCTSPTRKPCWIEIAVAGT